MRFSKPSSRKVGASPPETVYAAEVTGPIRWSDVAASRKSTHPDAAPIKRILDTTELCENIFECLPSRDLIRMQLLCRTTRAVITASPILQMKLFLKEMTEPLRRVVDLPCKLISVDEASKCTGPFGRVTPCIVCNPLLFSVNDVGEHSRLVSSLDRSVRYPTSWFGHVMIHNSVLNRMHAVLDNASCRAMFLTQPPVMKAVITIEEPIRREYLPWEDTRGLPKWDYGPVTYPLTSNKDGLTFGDVLDAIEEVKWRDEHTFSGICLPDVVVVSQEQEKPIEVAQNTAELVVSW